MLSIESLVDKPISTWEKNRSNEFRFLYLQFISAYRAEFSHVTEID
jgi:hypothetical protein